MNFNTLLLLLILGVLLFGASTVFGLIGLVGGVIFGALLLILIFGAAASTLKTPSPAQSPSSRRTAFITLAVAVLIVVTIELFKLFYLPSAHG